MFPMVKDPRSGCSGGWAGWKCVQKSVSVLRALWSVVGLGSVTPVPLLHRGVSVCLFGLSNPSNWLGPVPFLTQEMLQIEY